MNPLEMSVSSTPSPKECFKLLTHVNPVTNEVFNAPYEFLSVR